MLGSMCLSPREDRRQLGDGKRERRVFGYQRSGSRGGRGHKTCPETFRETFVPTSPPDYEELEGLRDHGAPDEGRYANFAALARLFRKKLSGEADEGGDFFLLS